MPSEDIFAVIADRHTVKRFSLRPVELDKILQIIQAGALAPSSGNIQNWSFIIVTDVAKIRAMHAYSMQQEPFLSAMAAIIVCGDIQYGHTMYGVRGQRLYTIQNCAAAVENMLLASQALGLGTCWVGAFDEDALASAFSIPAQQHRPQAVVLLGYPEVYKQEKERKPLENLVYFNKFGNKVMRPHLIYYDWATEWQNQAKRLREHVAVSKGKLQKRFEEKRAQAKEKITSDDNPLKRARERMGEVVDRLKREEYRRGK